MKEFIRYSQKRMALRIPGPIGLLHPEGDPLFPGLCIGAPGGALRAPLGTPAWECALEFHRSGAAPAVDRQPPARPRPAAGEPLDFNQVFAHIERWEGVVKWMYLDTHKPPLVTVGAGHMLPNVAAAKALAFVNTSTKKPATEAEIETAFQAVAKMTGGRERTCYLQKPSLEITVEAAKQTAIARLNREFIPQLKKWLPDFDSYPVPAREALIDMVYTMGIGRDAGMKEAEGLRAYTDLKAALESRDFKAASLVCRRTGARPERNAFAQELFEKAAAEEERNARERGSTHGFNPRVWIKP